MVPSSEMFLIQLHPFHMALHQVERMLHQWSTTQIQFTEMHQESPTTLRLELCHGSGDSTSHKRKRGCEVNPCGAAAKGFPPTKP
jgi:hypothetical protein